MIEIVDLYKIFRTLFVKHSIRSPLHIIPTIQGRIFPEIQPTTICRFELISGGNQDKT